MKNLSLPTLHFHFLTHFLLMKSLLCWVLAHACSLNSSHTSLSDPLILPSLFFLETSLLHEYFSSTFIYLFIYLSELVCDALVKLFNFCYFIV